MNNFFRRLHYNLLAQNKIGKYLKYNHGRILFKFNISSSTDEIFKGNNTGPTPYIAIITLNNNFVIAKTNMKY